MFAFFAVLTAIVGGFLEKLEVGENGAFVGTVSGRQHYLHGLNVVVKEHPWIPTRGKFTPQGSVGPEDIANLKKWGFNAVRLGVMWPGVEISPGVYNNTYLQEITQLINDLGDAGIYTLVDMHQDLLSRHYCGEGIPEFYVDDLLKDPDSLLSKGRAFPIGLFESEAYQFNTTFPPLEMCLSKAFASYYVSEKVGRLFQTLYTPGSVLQKGFIATWVEIAKAFKGNPNVLGFELLNEPWYGDVDSNPLLFVEKTTDQDYLQPMYLAATEQIRAIDPNVTIFFEEMPFSIRSVGFTKNPGAPQAVLSYHIYCSATPWKPGCEYGMEDLLEHKFNNYIQENHIGGMMTEFGAIADTTKLVDTIRHLLDDADYRMQSWTYWQFKLFHDITTASDAESLYSKNGTLELAKIKLLTRTFARKVAGSAKSMKFDSDTGVYTLVFNPTAGMKDPTEIHASPDFWAPAGVDVAATGGDGCTPKWSLDNSSGSGIVVNLDTSGCDGKSSVTVTVTPK